MAVLSYSIPESNFELIRDRIAIILKDELDNQASLQGDTDLTGQVFIERYTPVDPSEGTVLIVLIDRGNFTEQTQITQRAKFNYLIDIFTYDKQSDTEEGYYRSTRKLHRLAGLILNILQAPEYKKLGFADGIVYNRTVSDFQFDHPQDNQETKYARMGRITVTVDHHNQQPATDPITASGYDTQVKLDETDKGFQYITNN